jgi:hypothetical protein
MVSKFGVAKSGRLGSRLARRGFTVGSPESGREPPAEFGRTNGRTRRYRPLNTIESEIIVWARAVIVCREKVESGEAVRQMGEERVAHEPRETR